MQSIDPLSVGDQLVQVDEVDPQVIVTAVESLDGFGAYTMATTATTGPQVRCGVERWKLQRCVGKRSFLHRPAQNSLSSDVPAQRSRDLISISRRPKEVVPETIQEEAEVEPEAILTAEVSLEVSPEVATTRALQRMQMMALAAG